MKLKVAYAYVGTAAATASLINSKAYAANFGSSSAIKPQGNPDFSSNPGNIRDNIANIATSVLDIILLLAGILAVFYLVYSGILYITSAGNPDRVKTARAGIINSVIGIIIIVAAFFIIRVAVLIGNTAATSQNSTSSGF